MTDYVKQLTNPRNPSEFREAERLLGQFDTDTVTSGGIVRWKSNGQVPPQDVLDLWVQAGMIGRNLAVASAVVRASETAKFARLSPSTSRAASGR